MKLRSLLPVALATSLAAVLVPFAASAHKSWLLPSQTVVAGEKPWVTFDAAVSNDLFYLNHVPIALDRLSITAPDGSRGDQYATVKIVLPERPDPELESFMSGWRQGQGHDPRRTAEA